LLKMMTMIFDKICILIINGGSSSIKFALYEMEQSPVQLFSGEIENMGIKNTRLIITNCISHEKSTSDIVANDYEDAAKLLIEWLEKQESIVSVKAIGHRIVHGMEHTGPELITPELLEELKKISAYDPDHLPGEIKLIEVFRKRYPALAQVACFDTSFHTSMPSVAKLLPIPRRYNEKGIRRYGFHGLSYSYLMDEIRILAGSETAKGRIILAHLGSGASLAAVKDGKSTDTSMGFTPASGLPMGTRAGDFDPGLASYLMQYEKLSPAQFSHLINQESGLLGISETSSDMREIIKIKETDIRASDAFELFCYQTKKWIGSYVAILGGLDILVFAGGIGENSPEVRTQICSGMKFLGIELDEERNIKNESIISVEASPVCVRVIKTNEELMIARLVCRVLNYEIKN